MERGAARYSEGKGQQVYIPKARPMSSGTRHPRSNTGNSSARSDIVPFLSLQNRLEVQSSPIQLATRSLSSRSLSSLSSSSSHRPSSAKIKGTLPPKDSKRPSTGVKPSRQKKAKENTFTHSKFPANKPPNTQLPSKPAHTTEGKKGASKGFNIAGHLQESAELDRSLGSISPDVDQFLKDIGALVTRPLTPEISNEPQDTHTNGKSSSVTEQPVMEVHVPISSEGISNGPLKKPNRPKVAANFGTSVTNGDSTPVPALSIFTASQSEANSQQPGDTVKWTDPATTNVSLDTKQPGRNDSIPSDKSETKLPTSNVAESVPPAVVLKPGNSTQGQSEAATKIQLWYRRLGSAQYTKLQSVLKGKKDELTRSRAQEFLESESREAEKRERRAAKMQAARKKAIEELNKKREEKRLRAEKIAQEEIVLLQASGKIKKPPCKKPVAKESQEGQAKKDVKPANAPEQVIDEFFQAGSSRLKSPQPPSNETSPVQPVHKTATPHKHGSTYSDILETLKLLEEPPPPLASKSPRETNGAYLSAENLQKLSTPPANISLSNSASLSEGKLSNILAYLDEMEKADQDLLSQLSKSRAEVKTRGVTTAGATPRTARSTPRVKGRNKASKDADASLEAATAAASDVTTTILAQRIELDNKNKTIDMMQKALNQQRELTVYHAKEMEKDGQKKMELLRTEYESRIQRHQAFIDQLIDDKKVLSERCEQLVKQLRELDKKYKTNLKALEEKHSAEISKLKQVSAAAEKLRREKWKSDEVQRIKEATVKSLEPEIQRIIAKGKGEVQKLKALHEAEMMQVDERASRRFVAQMEELRAQCAEEKEQACAHERELARQRYEKMAEQEEVNYQQLRRKLFGEVQQEKNRLADQFQQQKQSTDQRIEDMQHANRSLLEELKSEHARQIAEMERRHTCQVKDLTERSKVEQQAWEENVLKKQEAEMMAKERGMREQLRKERDKEIELVITRLEEETTASRDELERAAEARVRRVREKYETELREVERSEQSTLEKFNNLKTQVVEHEGELSRFRTLLRQKQEEVEHVSEVASKLTRERDNVADIVRQEFADRLVRTEEENKDVKIEMSELRARHKVELEKVGKDKDREMVSVHDRVKQALSKKEDNLRTLREQYESALKRADHLEMLLEQQRKQLLKK